MLEAKNIGREISIKKIDNETVNITIFDNKVLMSIVGEFNKNLNKIEKLTNTKLFFRGNSITVKGKKALILNFHLFLLKTFLFELMWRFELRLI